MYRFLSGQIYVLTAICTMVAHSIVFTIRNTLLLLSLVAHLYRWNAYFYYYITELFFSFQDYLETRKTIKTFKTFISRHKTDQDF